MQWAEKSHTLSFYILNPMLCSAIQKKEPRFTTQFSIQILKIILPEKFLPRGNLSRHAKQKFVKKKTNFCNITNKNKVFGGGAADNLKTEQTLLLFTAVKQFPLCGSGLQTVPFVMASL